MLPSQYQQFGTTPYSQFESDAPAQAGHFQASQQPNDLGIDNPWEKLPNPPSPMASIQQPSVEPDMKKPGAVKSILGGFLYGMSQSLKKDAGLPTDYDLANQKIQQQRANTEEGYRQAVGEYNRQRANQLEPRALTEADISVLPPGFKVGQMMHPAAIEALQKQQAINQGKENVQKIKSGPQVPVPSAMAKQFGLPLGSTVPLDTFSKMTSASGKNLIKTERMVDGKPHTVITDKATGETVHDLGDSVGYKQSIDRAWAFATARKENTVTDVYDDNGNLVPMTEGQRLRKGIPKAQTEFAQQGPTSATRTAGQAAGAVSSHIPAYIQSVDNLAAKGQLGAVMGRINEYTNSGYFGDDPDVARFVADTKLLQSGTVRAHFGARGGEKIISQFNRIINTSQEPNAIKGAVGAIGDWLKTYGDIGQFRPQRSVSQPFKFTRQYQGHTYGRNSDAENWSLVP